MFKIRCLFPVFRTRLNSKLLVYWHETLKFSVSKCKRQVFLRAGLLAVRRLPKHTNFSAKGHSIYTLQLSETLRFSNLELTLIRSRYSDSLRTGRLRGRGSSPGRVKNFHFSMSSRPPMGSIQPPIQWVPGALSPGVKRPGSETDHSPPTSAEVKKMWIYTSTPLYAFMA
jgi:hypothetical protein